MFSLFRPLFFLGILLISLSITACSGTPTRHLVSDVSMIKAGQTTRQELISLMGAPDAKRMLSGGTEEWVYYEEDHSLLQDTPLVGGAFDGDGYSMVVITLSGDVVTTCRYSGFDDDEFDWQDDYSWQEIEKK
ncbi:MAG: hypothetical protein ABFS19_12140 [Thermodesulfobacteriota bacterium]